MTSQTGAEAQTLEGTVNPPSFAEAIAGATLQIGAMAYFWTNDTPWGAKGPGASHGSVIAALKCPFDVECELSSQIRSDPWASAIAANLMLIGLVFSVSVLHRGADGLPDPGIVDRIWSVTPWLNVWLMFYATVPAGGLITADGQVAGSLRVLIMAMLSTMWGIRLSWNYWRKGGYTSDGEDYRWVQVRGWFPGWRFHLFNPVFICTYQLLLLLAIAAPAAVAANRTSRPINLVDAWAGLSMAVLILGEHIADVQQFDFQTEKWRRKKAGLALAGPYEKGFISSGLWGVSRHPNYFCEVHIWWAFYGFSIAASGEIFNWAIVGPVMLNALFAMPGASLDTTEALSSRKYPQFPDYQAAVARFYPTSHWQTLLMWVWLLALVVYYETTPAACWNDWTKFGNQILGSDLNIDAGAMNAGKFLVMNGLCFGLLIMAAEHVINMYNEPKAEADKKTGAAATK